MDEKRPSSQDEKRAKNLTSKMIGKKKDRDFEGGQRSDSKDTKKSRKKRDLQTPGAKKKFLKKPKQARNIKLEFGLLTTPKQGLGLRENPEVEEREDLTRLPQTSLEIQSRNLFRIEREDVIQMSTAGKMNLARTIEIKANPLKEISKLIFNNARKKKEIRIPEDAFKIYVENMGHYEWEKVTQTLNTINYHKPAVVIVLETQPFYHKGYVTFVHQDSSQKMLIMVRRDLLHEVQVFQFKSFPIIKTFDTMICVVHSLENINQHLKLPRLIGRAVYIGDFNISSVAGKAESNIKEMMQDATNFSFEATWEMGYLAFGVAGGAIFIDQGNRDHQALVYSTDFNEPKRKLVPQAGKIKSATKEILEQAIQDPKKTLPFTKALNMRKGLMVRAKPVFTNEQNYDLIREPPKVWERIKSTTTPFINASEVKKEVLDSLRDYFRRYPAYQEKINFTQQDYDVAFYMFSYFLTRNRSKITHSRARDRNGVSYYDILDSVIEITDGFKDLPPEKATENTQKLFNYFWKQFIDANFTHTKCFLNRKRAVIKEHKDLRMLSIQDAMWKFIEVIFQPVTWVCNYVAVQNIPGTFGFVSGGATFNAFTAKCPHLGSFETRNESNLHPEEVTEEELDKYIQELDKQLELKEAQGDEYDITNFLFPNKVTNA